MSEPDIRQQINNGLLGLGREVDADVFVYNSWMDRAGCENLLSQMFSVEERRPVGALFLTTFGGDPDAAFRLARGFQGMYESFFVYILGPCKSAGTLTAIGAKRIVMFDFGELGPLDVQLARPDELYKTSSGLDIPMAFQALGKLVFENFKDQFILIKTDISHSITAKMAAEIATGLATSVVKPIAAQIDPLRVGEAERSMRIAMEYGKRLNPNAPFWDLTAGYPSHSFVIDLKEAVDIGLPAFPPSDQERTFGKVLAVLMRTPNLVEQSLIAYLGSTQPENSPSNELDPKEGISDGAQVD